MKAKLVFFGSIIIVVLIFGGVYSNVKIAVQELQQLKAQLWSVPNENVSHQRERQSHHGHSWR